MSSDRTFLVGNTRGDNILEFNLETGEFIRQFIPSRSGGLSSPDTLLYGPDANNDGVSDLYIASGSDFEDSAILRYDGVTGDFIDSFVGDDLETPEDETGGLIRPYGLAFGPDGNLYVASFRSDQILRYDGTTGAFIDVFAEGTGTADGLNGPNGLLFTPDGSLLVTTQGSVADELGEIEFLYDSQVLRYSSLDAGATPEVFATPTAPSGSFVSLLGLALGPEDGDLYVSDFAGGIRRYNLETGELLDTLETPSDNFLGSLAFTPTGDLLTVGFDTASSIGSLFRFDGATDPVTTTLPTGPNLLRPIGLTFSPDLSRLLIGNTRGDTVLEFDAETGEFIRPFVSGGNLLDPDTLLYGPDANNDGVSDLYIASGSDFGDSAILRYDGVTGDFIDSFVGDDLETPEDETGGLIRPYGLAFGPDGNLYVASFRSDQILRYDGTTGAFIDVFAEGTSTVDGLNGPNGLLFAPDGSLLVTTQGSVADASGEIEFLYDSQVLRYSSLEAGTTPEVFATPTAPPGSFVSLLGLALGPEDGDLYVSDFAGGIRRYNLETGELLDTLETPSDDFVGSVAFGPGNDLYGVGFDIASLTGSLYRFEDSANPVITSIPTGPNLLRPIGITLTPGEIEIAIAPAMTPREAGSTVGTFLLTLNHPAPTERLTINFSLSGTANRPADYTLAAGENITNLSLTEIAIAPGATTAMINVVPVDDRIVDPNETVIVSLTAGIGYQLSSDATATLAILDNDSSPSPSPRPIPPLPTLTPPPTISTPGNDVLTLTEGDDRFLALGGDDSILGAGGNDAINGNQGNDTLNGGSGNDTLFGGKGSDLLLSGLGNDVLLGNRGSDTLRGESGDDLLFGGKGNDVLEGGEGNDTLSGDLGQDTLIGGIGSDVFVLRTGTAISDPSLADLILDFQSGVDRIGLTQGLSTADLILELAGDDTTVKIASSNLSLGIIRGVAPIELSNSFVSVNIG